MSFRPNIIDAGDVLIVGGGLAGLFTALKLAHRQVTVMATDEPSRASASARAQGGIAAAIGADDSPDLHKQDTIAAGCGLVDPHIADILAQESKARINDLIAFGVPFDRHENGAVKLGREAAHSRNRIIGVRGDQAGRAIISALGKRASASPSIHKLVGFAACELAIENGRVVGVFARPVHKNIATTPILVKARAVILACGGAGCLYETTTNPASARGEALAMAARAGAVIGDAEFMQFHPTAFACMGDPAPLATEALRGEGAVLLNGQGERFMPALHKDAELAPRDIVARGVAGEIQRTGFVGLDLRGALGKSLAQHFPTVAHYCKQSGIDPSREMIPVTPAAHYHMGGIKVDENGQSSLAGLWACGEAASTGAHGANRLAGNSLLEAIVFGARIARHIDDIVAIKPTAAPEPPKTDLQSDPAASMVAIKELRHVMSQHVGLIRNYDSLRAALKVIKRLDRLSAGVAPLANMTGAALLIAAAALQREESRGGHFRSDFPKTETQGARGFMTFAQAHQIADHALAGARHNKEATQS